MKNPLSNSTPAHGSREARVLSGVTPSQEEIDAFNGIRANPTDEDRASVSDESRMNDGF